MNGQTPTSNDIAPDLIAASPYRGLTPYTEADAAYFFGRTREIGAIAANLEVARFTLFYGPSGVGKTSVLRAGVLHHLQERATANALAYGIPEIIPVYFNRWQQEPAQGLAQAVAAAVQPYLPDPAAVPPEGPLRSGPLLAQLQAWIAATDSDLLLILDQFEEYFLYHDPAQENDPADFASQLVQITNHSSLRVNLLISLREDALARLDQFKGRIPFLLDNRLSIGHLNRQAGREAVEAPLAQYNREYQTAYAIEDALVDAVLDQVGSGQVALGRQGTGGRQPTGGRRDSNAAPAPDSDGAIETPYLQLVLTRLWEEEVRQSSTQLRLQTLESLGGAAFIVRNYLDLTLDALPDGDQALAARFLDRLVTPSGTKIALTLSELALYANAPQTAVEAVIQTLQDRRLLRGVQTPDGTTQFEILHDVLGPALLDWHGRYQQTVEAKARLAEEQKARQEAEERATLETEARRAAQSLSEAQARAAAQFRWLATGLGIALAIAIAVTLFATVQTRRVTGFSLALEAENYVRDNDLRMATLLALEAQEMNRAQGDRLLDREIPLQVPFIRSFMLSGHSDAVWSVAWSPDGRQLASGSRDNSVKVWDVESGEAVRTLNGHSADVWSVAWSPDGRQLASGSWDTTVQLYPANYLTPPCHWITSNLTVEEWVRYRGWALYRPTCAEYPIQPLPGIWESLANNPSYLPLSLSGRFFIGGALLLVVALPSALGIWIVRRLLRWRRSRQLAGNEAAG